MDINLTTSSSQEYDESRMRLRKLSKVLSKYLLAVSILLPAFFQSWLSYANSNCSGDTRNKIWIPANAQSQFDNLKEEKVELPIAFLNNSALNPLVFADMTFEICGALYQNHLDITRDTVSVGDPASTVIPSLEQAFQSPIHSIVYTLDTPDQGVKTLRTKTWVSGLIKSIHVEQQIGEQIIDLSQKHCFRGAMIFKNTGGHLLSLLIWNGEVIDESEAQRAPCLLNAFITKSSLTLTPPDIDGRQFLAACN